MCGAGFFEGDVCYVWYLRKNTATDLLVAATVIDTFGFLICVQIGMNMNWHGFLGPNIKKFFGHTGSDVLSGLIGWRTENFGVPFSLTEEFTAVYRMHSLLRDDFDMVRVSSQGKLVDKMPLLNMTFAR